MTDNSDNQVDIEKLAQRLLDLNAKAEALEIQLDEEKSKPRKKRIRKDLVLPYTVSHHPTHVARHYDAHNLNDGIYMPQPHRTPDEQLYVYCFFHRHTHPLCESVYVNLGPTQGAHWVCREVAKEKGWDEYVVK